MKTHLLKGTAMLVIALAAPLASMAQTLPGTRLRLTTVVVQLEG